MNLLPKMYPLCAGIIFVSSIILCDAQLQSPCEPAEIIANQGDDVSLTCFTTWNLEGTIFWWLSYNSRAYDIAHGIGSNLAGCAIHPLFKRSSRYSCDYHAEQSENTKSLTLRIKNVSLNNARTYRCSYRDSTTNFTNVCMLRIKISNAITVTAWTTLPTYNEPENQTIQSTARLAPTPSSKNVTIPENSTSIPSTNLTPALTTYNETVPTHSLTPKLTPTPFEVETIRANLYTSLTKYVTIQTISSLPKLTPTCASKTAMPQAVNLFDSLKPSKTNFFLSSSFSNTSLNNVQIYITTAMISLLMIYIAVYVIVLVCKRRLKTETDARTDDIDQRNQLA